MTHRMQNKEACKSHCWQNTGATTLQACCAGALLIEIIEIIGQAYDDHGLQAARFSMNQGTRWCSLSSLSPHKGGRYKVSFMTAAPE